MGRDKLVLDTLSWDLKIPFKLPAAHAQSASRNRLWGESHGTLGGRGEARPGRGAGAGPGMTVEVVVARKLFAKTGSACSSLLFDISFHIAAVKYNKIYNVARRKRE